MKKLLFTILAAISCLIASGQAQINISTKKDKTSDFIGKMTKVVLTGDTVLDAALKDGVKNAWTINPYEFCSQDEFAPLMTNDDYYFLVPSTQRLKKDTDAGIRMIYLLKGTKGASVIGDMMEVASFPMCQAGQTGGQEAYFLPALVNIIQSYVSKSLANGFKGIGKMVEKPSKSTASKIIFAARDLASGVEEQLKDNAGSNMEICSEEEAGYIMLNSEEEILVSYVVVPQNIEKGASAYKMVIGSRSHTLYYFKKTAAESAGFTKGEVLKFAKALGK